MPNLSGTNIIFQVDSVLGDVLTFSETYPGGSFSAPIFTRKKNTLPSDSSAHLMKKSLQSLPGVGSVDVSRFGPSPEYGYLWKVTFTSNTDSLACSSSLSSCILGQEKTYQTIEIHLT